MEFRRRCHTFMALTCYLTILLVMVTAQENTITIPDSYELVDYVCGDQQWQITNDTTITLDAAVEHVIPSKQLFCVVQDKWNVTLQSSSEKEVAVIRCDGDNVTQSGFGFVGVSSLTVRNVRFENCGGIIRNSTFVSSNTSPENKIENMQHAVLFLSNCTNVQVENVIIDSYRGYAIFAVNVFGEVRIRRSNITNSFAFMKQMMSSSRNDLIESGSGILFHFNDKAEENSTALLNSRIHITNFTTITNNFNIYPEPLLRSIRAVRLQNQERNFPIPGAGGLSVHFEQHKFRVELFVEDTEISNNGGSVSGGIQVFSRNTIDNADVKFNRCIFRNNTVHDFSGYIGGGGLQLIFIYSYFDLSVVNATAGTPKAAFTIENTDFISHYGILGAAITIFNEPQNVRPISIKLSNTSFIDNEATVDGDCILVRNERSAYYRGEELELILEGIQVEHNGRSSTLDTSSALSFVNVDFIRISGSKDKPGLFSNGNNGALKAYDSYIFLSGELKFIHNNAPRGGAIALESNSHLFFVEPANILFLNNTAIAGGAIHSDSISGSQCVMQFVTPTSNYSTNVVRNASKLADLNLNITFADNTATDGNSVYAHPIYNCSWYSESIVQLPSNQVDSVYRELFYFTVNGQWSWHINQMRSYPYKPCFCHNRTLPSDVSGCQSNLKLDTFPGQPFTIDLVSIDSLGRPLRSLVKTKISVEQGNNVTFGRQQLTSVHDLTGRKCSHLNYTLYGADNVTARLDINIPNTDSESQMIETEVNLQACPFGFKLSPDQGFCECVFVFSRYNIMCDIETGKFAKKGTYWIGPTYFEDPAVPGIAIRCPEGYCKSNDTLYLNETNGISPDELCLGNRTGEICGKCMPGQSMMFGTTNCDSNCLNYYLFTIPAYMLAGILLVFILFLLKMSTSSGTLSVVLFYAQLISINLGLLVQSNATRFAYVFISLLNLELGFPLCFYKGMNLIGKHGLQFVFPVYLWILVALLTVLSRYSTRISDFIGSECIKVFVTLIYLSYTKILRTAFAVLVPAHIRTDDQTHTVWFFDGTVKFLSGNHLVLVIISIIFLVFIIAPYTVFLFSAQWSLKSSWISRRFKPLIDASLAPFKDRYRFWFGLRLIIIAVLVIFAIFFSPSNPDVVTYIHLIIVFFLIIFQAYVRPYKSKAVNILDIFFLTNYTLFLIGCLFVFSGTFHSVSDLNPYIAAVEMIAIGSAFLVFVGIVIYHVIARVRNQHNKKYKVHLNSPDKDLANTGLKENTVVAADRQSSGNPKNITVIRVEMNRLREPLLDDEY